MRIKLLSVVAVVGICILATGVFGLAATEPARPDFIQKAISRPELQLTTATVPLPSVRGQLRNPQAWEEFFLRDGTDTDVRIDPRSGTPASVMFHHPLVPGDGVGNELTLKQVEGDLGHPVTGVDEESVAAIVAGYVRRNTAAFGIEPAQLGAARAFKITDDLWQINIPQVVRGIPVRGARVAATISHGNLVLLGTEMWGDVKIKLQPAIDATEAEARLYRYLGGRREGDATWKSPALEIVPVIPPGGERAVRTDGVVGDGYAHRLVWVLGIDRPYEEGRWEALVDAQDGETLYFADTVQDLKKKVTGSVYPAAGNNTGACPGPTCGVLQSGYPMPWADTGLSSPNNFTNSAGVLNYTSGTVTTTLNGKYAKITDECGAISESSSTGTLDLGGSVGADCLSTGSSLGDTNASRTVYYELNKVAEIGRGWLPNNNWLKAQQTATVNRNTLGSCGAFWNGTQFFFDRTVPRNQSCQMCNNPGQTASVIDHEWGHGLDNNDATPNYGTRFSEGFADIAAIYRQQQSCIGYGQRTVPQCDTGDPTTCDVADPPACPQRCGTASDGNPNAYEDYPGGPNPNKHCTTDCSGARDADWRKHADGVPDTPQNFVCSTCPAEGGTPGPCGKDIYCGAAPMRQAAWDLAAFDLQSSPFSFDSKTAFVIASRLFHVGSGNTTSWHSCDCVAGTSDGCGAASGYKQWLAADDDNGNLNDGTPHMTAIYNAFNRHNIACSTPTVQNHGCQDAPSGIPTLTATAGSFSSALTWTSVSGAAKYFVFRTEGHNGCDLGRALIAQPTSASYTDTEVAAGRQYCYSVAAAGGLSACFARLSTCQCVTPVP